MPNIDELDWDLEERDQFMEEYGERTDIEPEAEVLVAADE